MKPALDKTAEGPTTARRMTNSESRLFGWATQIGRRISPTAEKKEKQSQTPQNDGIGYTGAWTG